MKVEEPGNKLPLTKGDCTIGKDDIWCTDCDAICYGRCRIIRDFKKSIWKTTVLITVTWIPDVICICVFSYYGSTSAVIISYMYISWMMRDAITKMVKVLDDKAQPVRLIKQMFEVFAYLSKFQIPLNKAGLELKDVNAVIIQDIDSAYGKFSNKFPIGVTIGGANNGSGKSVLMNRIYNGNKEGLFIQLKDESVVPMKNFTVQSKRKGIKYVTPDDKLPRTHSEFYDSNKELANELNIDDSIAKLPLLSKGQYILFLLMRIVLLNNQGIQILLLDELFANLDDTNRENAMRVIRKYCKCVIIIIDNNCPAADLNFTLTPRPSSSAPEE